MIRIVDFGNSMIIYHNDGEFDEVVAEINCDLLSNKKAYEICNLIKEYLQGEN